LLLIRKQIYLPEEANRRLIEYSKSKNIPQAEVIRESVEKYLDTLEAEDQKESWDQFIDKMRSSDLRLNKWKRDELYRDRMDSSGGKHGDSH
jgi:predicted DNA-binding protein